MNDFVIVKEHPQLITYIDYLQKKNAESLSFYPTCVFERESEKGRLFLGLLNNQPCGYLYVGSKNLDVKCHQVCIQYDARRKLYGAALVVAMEDYAKQFNANTITLRCGFDLDANIFWKEMGYNCIAKTEGGIRRMRTINIWRKYLMNDLFQNIVVEPAIGKTNSTIWRKHKKTGIVTGFNRGEKLKLYRAQLIADAMAEQWG